jgi:HK97 family phage major capsid protein
MDLESITDLRDLSAGELRTFVDLANKRLRELHLDQQGEPRDLTPAEQRRFDGLLELRDAAQERLDAHERAADAFAGRGGQVVHNRFGAPLTGAVEPFDTDVRSLSADAARDRALRALETRGRHLGPEQQDQVDALLRSQVTEDSPSCDGSAIARRLLITESEDYRSAFGQYVSAMLHGRPPVLTGPEAEAFRALQALEAAESRAMSEGTPSAGGVGVPVMIDPSIMLTAQQSGTDLLRLARQEVITTSAWKGVTSAGVSWSFDAEAAVVSDDSPTLAQPVVNVGMARGFIPYSIELGQDYPRFADEMGTLLAEGYNELLANNLIQGAGTNNGPIGIATALEANTNVQLILTTASTFPVTDVYRVWKALPKRARRRATWLSSQDTQNKVRQFGAASAGTADPNFTVDLQAGQIQALFGREYVVDDYMDDLPASGTAAATFAIVGDFSRFLVARRAGMSVEPVTHLFDTTTGRPTGQRGLFAWARIGSDSIDDLAFRALVNKTS